MYAAAIGKAEAIGSVPLASINTEADTALTDYDPPTKAEADAVITTAATEAYAADNANASIVELLYEIRGLLSEKAVSGTTVTMKKKDGNTTAATYTLDDSTNPTSITRAS